MHCIFGKNKSASKSKSLKYYHDQRKKVLKPKVNKKNLHIFIIKSFINNIL